jgi:hypothetical protein
MLLLYVVSEKNVHVYKKTSFGEVDEKMCKEICLKVHYYENRSVDTESL